MFSSEECNYFGVILDYVDFLKIYLNNWNWNYDIVFSTISFIHTNVSPHHLNREVTKDSKTKLLQLFWKGKTSTAISRILYIFTVKQIVKNIFILKYTFIYLFNSLLVTLGEDILYWKRMFLSNFYQEMYLQKLTWSTAQVNGNRLLTMT